jgi:hypothetical protein
VAKQSESHSARLPFQEGAHASGAIGPLFLCAAAI